MEIVLIVAIVAVAATGLYVAVTFNKRARQTTAPLIDAAVSDISAKLTVTADDLRRQLRAIGDDLHQDREQRRLDGRKIQGRLDHADSQISSMANRFLAELDAIKRRGEQIGTRQDQFSGDLQQLAARLAGEPGRLYVERLQFSTIRPPSEPGVRIVVERQVAELPPGQFRDLGDASTIISRAESDPGFRDRLGEAASDYFATKLGDPAFAVVTEGWMTQSTYPVTAAAEICNRIGAGLDGIVERPLGAIGTGLRLPGPLAATGAGIGADLILQPVTKPLGQVTRFLEITGVVVGVATGLHPLALAAGKMLAHDESHQLLARGITEAAHLTLTRLEPASPSDRIEPTSTQESPTTPLEITRVPDRRLHPVQDLRPSQVDDLDELHGPSIEGPGQL